VSEIPNFVRQTEDRIQHLVQLPMFRKSQSGAITANNRFLSAPSDFVSMYSIAVIDASADYFYLINKDVNFIREAFRANATAAQPRYYAMFKENTFILGPTPSASLDTEIHYFYKPESLVTAGSTFLGDEAEAAMLYGSLVEAYIYMKGEADLLQMYDTKFKEALVKLKELGDGKNRQDAYRSGQARMAVS
tara:strand:+ start:1984 stop:2556 length:573 start_codon:yes stop_codon:yes gene_type:complete